MALSIITHPPYRGKLYPLKHYYEKTNGRLIKVFIKEYPQNVEDILKWLIEREERGYYVFVAVTYSTQLKTWLLKIKLHEDSEPIFICFKTRQIFVKRNDINYLLKLSTDLRYLTYYGGYSTFRTRTKPYF